MANLCGKCNKACNIRSDVACFGSCHKLFHPVCVDYNFEKHVKVIKESPFIKFVCMPCQDENRHILNTNVNEMNGMLRELSATITEIKKGFDVKFDSLTVKVNDVAASGVSANEKFDNLTSKVNDVTAAGLSPVSYADIIGSGEPTEFLETVAVKRRQFIYVTNLKPTTKAVDVIRHINTKTGVEGDDVTLCWPLIPKGRSVDQLNFISFKIGVYEEHMATILCPDFWPVNVRVRPFIFKPQNNVSKNLGIPLPAIN